MKISVRIFLGYFLIVGVAAWFLIDSARDRLKPALRQAMEDSLVDSANLLAELARDEVKQGSMANGHFAARVADFQARRIDAVVWGIRKDKPEYRIYVTDDKGRVLYDSAHLAEGQDFSRWNDVYLTLRGHYGARSTKSDEAGGSVMHVAAPIVDAGRIIGVVTVAKPSASVQPFFDLALSSLSRAGALVLLASVLVGTLLSWWLTRSLQRLLDYAEAVGRGERVRLPKLGGGEVAVLGRAMEAMRTELEGKRYVEDYVHSLTHELKSPLAAIQGAAELISPAMPAPDQARFLDNIRREAARLTTITDRLLALAQLESRKQLDAIETIDLPALLAELVDAKAAQCAARHIHIAVQCTPGLQLSGERFLLGQALSNLLDNAIDFSPNGGEITVSAGIAANRCQISIRDHGPGIPDYALARLFERFYSLPRPASQRKSTGLGLPFVGEVAKLHGGTITVRNADDGGALAQLVVPLPH
ncbi:two-component system sensor histidine kinase CreC [Chitinimonas sp.]|uniref:two-component system sensor histidine kinase CreC n=1 Tax=Chitinimonas sp. TaxID=1934313 RepID=UPI0035B361A4